jgi:hypothetical protein
MTVDTLVERVAEATERRRFLGRLGTATAAALAGAMGLATEEAKAYRYHGCDLCKSPPGGCVSPGCNWCWWGDCHFSNGRYHENLCCERHSDRCTDCSRSCTCIVCSYLGGTRNCR